MGVKPPEPPRAPAATAKAPRGWSQPVWDLRMALLAASQRLARGTGLQALCEGVERYVKLTGRGKPGPGAHSAAAVAWWRDVLYLVDGIDRVADTATRLLLAPWTKGSAEPGGGFRPFGVD